MYCIFIIDLSHCGYTVTMGPSILTGATPLITFPPRLEKPAKPVELFGETKYLSTAKQPLPPMPSTSVLVVPTDSMKVRKLNPPYTVHATFTEKHLKNFADTLAELLQIELEDNNSKPHINK